MSSNCSECINCKKYTYRELDDLLYSLNTSIAELGYADVLKKKYGYELGGKFMFSFKKLKVLSQALRRHMWLLKNEIESCLCDREVQELVERVKEIIDFVCEEGCRADLKVEANPYPQLSSPGCYYYEDWEKALYKVCPSLTISEEFQEVCKITFDFVQKEQCSTLSIIDEVTQKCQLRLEDEAFVERCRLEYQELLNDECDFTFDEYLQGQCQYEELIKITGS